jgi:hypothetical protein
MRILNWTTRLPLRAVCISIRDPLARCGGLIEHSSGRAITRGEIQFAGERVGVAATLGVLKVTDGAAHVHARAAFHQSRPGFLRLRRTRASPSPYLRHVLRPRRRRRHVHHGSPGHLETVLALVRYRRYLQK